MPWSFGNTDSLNNGDLTNTDKSPLRYQKVTLINIPLISSEVSEVLRSCNAYSGYKLYQILIFLLKLKTLPLAIFIIGCFQQPVLEHRDSIKLILLTASSMTFLNETDVFCFVF